MAGRRSGRSASTDVAHSLRTHWLQETSVIKTIPAGAPEDDWPIFELTDATVFKKDGKTIVNALDVLLEGPFIVRGNLIKDAPDQAQHLIMNVHGSKPIEIPACTRYSVGEASGPDDDDEAVKSIRVSRDPILWLSGRGAWYEIRPSAEYSSTYRTICDSIRLYYAMYDIHNPKNHHHKIVKKSLKSSDPMERLSEVFLCYVIKVGNGLTIEEVAQKCKDVAPFLINQFLENEGDEDLDWAKTFFYKWIKKDHEDLFNKTMHALRNPKQAPSALPDIPTRTKRAESSNHDENVKTLNQPEPAQRTRSTRSRSTVADVDDTAASESINNGKKAAVPKPAAVKPAHPAEPHGPSLPPKSMAPQDQPAFDTVLKCLEQAFDELSRSKKGVTKLGIANKLYTQNKIITFKSSQSGCHRIPVEELLHYCAPALLRVLDASKWKDNDFYPWLVEAAQTPFDPISMPISAFPYPLLPRTKSNRPSAAKGPATSATHTPSGVAGPSGRDEDDDTSMDEFTTPRTQRIGKGVKTPGRLGKSSLRPVASSKKRVHAEVDADSDSDSPNAKKSHYFSDGDDTMEDALGDQLVGDDTEEQVKIVIRADKIPSTLPKGPDETWTCDQDDCHYIVRGSDADKCQERIRQHFEEHEQQSERVQLAMSESQGHLPINHLLDKIKTLGESVQGEEQQFVGDVALPRPIQRKLLV